MTWARKLSLLGLSLGLAAVMLLAAIPKLLNPAEFALMLFRYELVPDFLINPAAIILPVLELLLGVSLLCVRPLRDAAALLTGVLCSGFAIVLGITLARGLEIACGCFGLAAQTPISVWHVAADVMLAALAFLLAYVCRSKDTSLSATSPGT